MLLTAPQFHLQRWQKALLDIVQDAGHRLIHESTSVRPVTTLADAERTIQARERDYKRDGSEIMPRVTLRIRAGGGLLAWEGVQRVSSPSASCRAVS